MLSGALWPAHPKPLPGECLSSWLVRCAHHNGLKVQTFCDRVFGKEHQVWNRDVDRLAPPWLLQVITAGTGASPHSTDNTTMKLFEGRLFEHRNRGGQLRWVLLLGQYHRLHQGFGMQYCPLCLGEDKEPYYRLSWRLAFYTFCPRHQTLLLDRCHACGAPVAFHRIELGRPGRYDTPSLDECWRCQARLSGVQPLALERWHQGVFQRWERWLKAVDRQFVNSGRIDYGCMARLHEICRRIVSEHKFPALQRNLCRRSGQPVLSLTISRRPFEHRGIQERHYVLGLGWWLILKYVRQHQS